MKICNRCKERKPLDEFSPRGKYKQSRCKPCLATLAREYRARHPERIQATNRKALYGISLAETLSRLEDQAGLCACCLRAISLNSLRVDHDHASKAVRGLLCQSCNSGIGLLGDSAAGVDRALTYLRRSDSATAPA